MGRSTIRILAVVFLAALIWTAIVFAQAPAAPAQAPAATQEPEAPPIRVRVTEVVVPVTVTDAKDQFVKNLTKDDFEVWDQGYKQEIRFFSAENKQPVVVGFLVDLSNSMKIRWKTFQENAIEMVLALMPGGDPKYAGYLVGYSTKAEVMVNTTTDSEKIVEKLGKLTPGGGAALYDAIYQACTNRKIMPGEPLEPHRVIVIVGDGHDNASSHTIDEVIQVAQKNLVAIYAMSTDAYGMGGEYSKNLKRLAEETGGRVEFPLENTYDNTQGFLSRPADEGAFEFKVGTGGFQSKILTSLFNSIKKIVGEIETQYILRYVPNTGEDMSSVHKLQVKVKIPNVNVRSRTSYVLDMQ